MKDTEDLKTTQKKGEKKRRKLQQRQTSGPYLMPLGDGRRRLVRITGDNPGKRHFKVASPRKGKGKRRFSTENGRESTRCRWAHHGNFEPSRPCGRRRKENRRLNLTNHRRLMGREKKTGVGGEKP